MRKLIGRILWWFLREDTGPSDAQAVSADEYVQIQKASWDAASGCWNAQIRVFTRSGTISATVQTPVLNKAHIRAVAARGN